MRRADLATVAAVGSAAEREHGLLGRSRPATTNTSHARSMPMNVRTGAPAAIPLCATTPAALAASSAVEAANVASEQAV